MEEKERFRQYWILALKIIGVLTALFVFFWIFDKILWLISLLLVSILIVYSITPLTDWLEKKKFSRTSASVITFFFFILFFLALLYIIIPRFYNELMELTTYAPVLFDILEREEYLKQLQILMEENYFKENFIFTETIPPPIEELQELSRHLIQVFFQLITTFFDLLVLMFLIFYLLKDLREIKKGIIMLVPKKYQDEATQILEVIDLKVGQFLRGNLIRCSLVGVITGLILFMLDIRFYFILALITAILNIIPYIGPFIAAIPAILVALSHSLEIAVAVGIMYILIQSLDAFILYPVLLGKAVDLKPFTVIVAISIGGALYGIIGFIISVPLAAILKVMLQYYYLNTNS